MSQSKTDREWTAGKKKGVMKGVGGADVRGGTFYANKELIESEAKEKRCTNEGRTEKKGRTMEKDGRRKRDGRTKRTGEGKEDEHRGKRRMRREWMDKKRTGKGIKGKKCPT